MRSFHTDTEFSDLPSSRAVVIHDPRSNHLTSGEDVELVFAGGSRHRAVVREVREFCALLLVA